MFPIPNSYNGLRNNTETKRSIKDIQVFGNAAPTHGLQHVQFRGVSGLVKLQEVVHVLVGEGAHVVPTVGVANLGHPPHPLGPVGGVGHHVAELDAELADPLDGVADTGGELVPDPLPDARGETRTFTVGAHHDLERAVAVDAAEVEVAFRGHVGDVGRDAVFLAQLPDLCRRSWIVDGDEDHVGSGVGWG